MANDEMKQIWKVPEPTLRRLPWYLAFLKLMKGRGEAFVSSTQIAKEINVDPSQVAKDLSFVNISGKTRVGYEISTLVDVLEDFLGFTAQHKAFLFGVGSLGAALLQDSGLKQYGLEIVGGFDVRRELAGTEINGIPVYHMDDFPAKQKEYGATIDLHTHYTSGVASMTYLKAVEAGCDMIDTAMSPFALGTSQPATEVMVETFSGTRYDTGLNKDALAEIAEYFRPLREEALASGLMNTKVLGVDINTLRYQVPGGMLSNLVSQLKEAHAEDKYYDVLQEIPRVRKDFGEPPLVTPSSQIVGTQAVLNVLMGQRYKMFTKESKKLLMGELIPLSSHPGIPYQSAGPAFGTGRLPHCRCLCFQSPSGCRGHFRLTPNIYSFVSLRSGWFFRWKGPPDCCGNLFRFERLDNKIGCTAVERFPDH